MFAWIRRWQRYKQKALILDALGDSLKFGIWARDKKSGRYIWASKHFYTTFDIDPGELIGKTPGEVFDQDVADEYERTDDITYIGHDVARTITAQVGKIERLDVVTKKTPMRDGNKIVGSVGYSFRLEKLQE